MSRNYFIEDIKSTFSYDVEIFGPVAYLTITTETTTISYEIAMCLTTGLSTQDKAVVSNVCIPLNYYNEQKQIHGNSPIWVRNIPRNKILVGLSEEFVDLYKSGRYWLCDHKDRINKVPVISLLKQGKFHLIGRDDTGSNGTIIGTDGQPMLHNIYFDYISANLCSKKFMIRKLLEHLKANPNVFDAAIEEVPSYNAYDGDKAIVFGYKITPELHQEFTNKFGYYSASSDVKWRIFELLEIEKFRKEEDDE